MRKAESNLEELRPLVDEEHCFHSTLIICPWCFSVTTYRYEQCEDECTICRRTITDSDIDEYLEREGA